MNKKPILSCEHLAKQFKEGSGTISVLNDVQFEIHEGEMAAIMGSSGSGKSTLLHILAGLDQPTKGKVFIGEHNWALLSERKRCQLRNRELGFVYQFHHLLPEFTALENVMMPLLIRNESMERASSEAAKMLSEVGLSHRLTHVPGELSGGERQRVAIARALVGKPKCVLADEPTGNLDPANALNVLSLFLDLQKSMNTSIILVTHDHDVAKHADRVLRLHDGKLE